jgi:hypothetical protein
MQGFSESGKSLLAVSAGFPLPSEMIPADRIIGMLFGKPPIKRKIALIWIFHMECAFFL